MRLPKRIGIKGNEWQLAYKWRLTLAGKQADGVCDYSTRTIWIDRSLSPELKFAAFIHEFIHAVLWEYDLGHNASKKRITTQLEEEIVSAIETELLACFKLRLIKSKET